MSKRSRRKAASRPADVVPGNETTVPWKEVPGPGGARVAKIASDARGTVYAETEAGVHASSDDGASWRLLRGAGARVLVSPGGEPWIACAGRVVRAGDAPAAEPVAAPHPLPPPPRHGTSATTALAMDLEGTLWAGIESHELSFYPTDVGRGPPILQSATLVTREIRRSTDGGATWKVVSKDLGASAIAFDARGRAWVAGNLGLHVSEDAGATWRRVFDRPGQCLAIAGERVAMGTSMAAYVSNDGGKTFQPAAGRYRESGSWGSLEGDALDFRVLARAPDGAIWGGAAGLGGGVFRLAESGTRWESVNLGLTIIPRVGARQGSVRPAALAFTPAGTAFVATDGHGLFRRRPEPRA